MQTAFSPRASTPSWIPATGIPRMHAYCGVQVRVALCQRYRLAAGLDINSWNENAFQALLPGPLKNCWQVGLELVQVEMAVSVSQADHSLC